MRLLDYLFALVSLAGLMAASWWGVYQSPQNAANLEARLQQKTSAALSASGMNWASVRMDGQVAVLSGQAPSADAVRDAAEAILTADGPGGLIFGGVTQVLNTAGGAMPVSPYVWRAEKTAEGGFVLSGHVPSKSIRAALLAEARAVAGDKGVEDQMQLASGAPVGNWQGMARLGIQELAVLESGEVRLSDTTLRLRGVAMDPAVRAKVSAEIANIAAPFRGEPSVKGVALWSARHGEGFLLIEGKVSSETERREILSLARRHYDGEVRDAMVLADQDYSGWMEAVRLGLPMFAKFRSGEMDFDPDGAGFGFDGQAAGSTLAYLRQDLARLTGPYKANIAAETVRPDVPEIEGMDFTADPAAACEAAFAAVLDGNAINFAGASAEITRDSGPALDKLVAVAGDCDPSLVFELGGHAGDREPVSLGRARADAVAAFMVASGVDRDRVSAIGYGPDAPPQGSDSGASRASDRLIQIKVMERSE